MKKILLVLALLAIPFTVNAKSITSSQMKQMESKWTSHNGNSHPFAQLESLLASSRSLTSRDIAEGNCSKSWTGGYKCSGRIGEFELNSKRQVTSYSACKQLTFMNDLRRQFNRYDNGSSIIKRMKTVTTRAWNNNARYLSYSYSGDNICLNASFSR